MKRTRVLIAAGFLCFLAFAQAVKPDFSGTWKLNNGKSTKDGPENRVYMNQIEESNTTITVTTKADGVTNVLDGTFPTNSKYHIEKVGSNYRYTKVSWEGATLVFEITLKDGKKDTSKSLSYLRESWTLSPDGKTLVKFRRTADGKSVVDQKYVFDKQ